MYYFTWILIVIDENLFTTIAIHTFKFHVCKITIFRGLLFFRVIMTRWCRNMFLEQKRKSNIDSGRVFLQSFNEWTTFYSNVWNIIRQECVVPSVLNVSLLIWSHSTLDSFTKYDSIMSIFLLLRREVSITLESYGTMPYGLLGARVFNIIRNIMNSATR